jgi:hypothetical protein
MDGNEFPGIAFNVSVQTNFQFNPGIDRCTHPYDSDRFTFGIDNEEILCAA